MIEKYCEIYNWLPVHSSFFSLHKYLLSTSYVPGIVFEAGNIRMGTKALPSSADNYFLLKK